MMSGTRQSSGTWITFVAVAIVGILFAFIFLRADRDAQEPASYSSGQETEIPSEGIEAMLPSTSEEPTP